MRVAAAFLGAIFLAALAMAQAPAPAPAERVLLEVHGRLEAGLVAIGGETTGIVVRAKGLTFELDPGKDEALRRRAESLDRQQVILRGTLEPRDGVELRRKRLIVRATSLEPAPE
jgi:hypothetical protein